MAKAETKAGRLSGGFNVVIGVLGLSTSACGGALSSDQRPDIDADAPLELSDHEPAREVLDGTGECAASAAQLAEASGYSYATPPGFWLGAQETKTLGVEGAGLFVLGEPDGEPPGRRYSRDLAFFVAPDGSLQDASGRRLLGYAPGAERCLAPLRAPWLAPPAATGSVAIQVNLDPREPVLAFVLEEAEGTSNLSVTASVTDSQGGPHLIDIYFHHLPEREAFGVHVTADGSELFEGVPGERVLLGSGLLRFSSDGGLYSDVMPLICASFRTGDPDQCFSVDFGHSMTEGNPYGTGGSTGLASSSSVYAVSADGWGAGVGADVQVDGWGDVSARFDNGSVLALGTLALARFPREPGLITEPDGVLRESDQSGQPQLGEPLSPGRGSVRFAAPSTPFGE